MRGEVSNPEYDTRLSHVAFKQAWKLMRLAVDTRCEKNLMPFFTGGKRTTAHPGTHSVVDPIVPQAPATRSRTLHRRSGAVVKAR